MDGIAKSISSFGFNAPILTDGQRRVLAGHARLEAAAFLGLQEVPVITLDDLTPAQAQAYMLADNKLTDRSEFNFEQKELEARRRMGKIAPGSSLRRDLLTR